MAANWTQRTYEMVATELAAECERQGFGTPGEAAVDAVARRLAERFQADNPRFSYKRFMAAASSWGRTAPKKERAS